MARRRLGFWRRLAVVALKPPLWLFTKRHWRGAEHVPTQHGVIVVANHVSHADPLVTAHFVYDAGRWPQFLAKQSVFDVALLGRFLRRARQIPVPRGTANAANAIDAAIDAVRAGDAVVIYPEGTTTKQPQLWPMRGKTGVARLWLATGAPVVPVASWGAHTIFDPRSGKLRLRPRTPITVLAGPPIDLTRFAGVEPTTTALHEITEVVMQQLAELVGEIRNATPPPLWSPVARNGGQQ